MLGRISIVQEVTCARGRDSGNRPLGARCVRPVANQRLTDTVAKELLEGSRLILVGEVIGATRADIEDLFEPAEYLALYNAAFADDLSRGILRPRQHAAGEEDRSRAAAIRSRSADGGAHEECQYCGRRFERRTRGTGLKPHKDKFKNPCYGRAGILVDQRYG